MIRTSIRWTGALLPIVAAAQLASAQTALPPAATLLAKHAAAVGGPAYLNAKSIVTKGGFAMPAAGINATFQMTQISPNLMQMVTTIPGMGDVVVGFDGTNALLWTEERRESELIINSSNTRASSGITNDSSSTSTIRN